TADFPVTDGVFPRNLDYGFVTKITTTGDRIVYSAFLPPSEAIAVDGNGFAYVAGQAGDGVGTVNGDQETFGGRSRSGKGDAFVAKINRDASALLYATYLGGSLDDWGRGIAVDSREVVTVTGGTYSAGFPTRSPLQPGLAGEFNAFIAKIDTTLAGADSLRISTFRGRWREDV